MTPIQKLSIDLLSHINTCQGLCAGGREVERRVSAAQLGPSTSYRLLSQTRNKDKLLVLEIAPLSAGTEQGLPLDSGDCSIAREDQPCRDTVLRTSAMLAPCGRALPPRRARRAPAWLAIV